MLDATGCDSFRAEHGSFYFEGRDESFRVEVAWVDMTGKDAEAKKADAAPTLKSVFQRYLPYRQALPGNVSEALLAVGGTGSQFDLACTRKLPTHRGACHRAGHDYRSASEQSRSRLPRREAAAGFRTRRAGADYQTGVDPRCRARRFAHATRKWCWVRCWSSPTYLRTQGPS